jgi:hypothetical protein
VQTKRQAARPSRSRPTQDDLVSASGERLAALPPAEQRLGTSLSALHPELPSNKWTRALSKPWVISGRPTNRLAHAKSIAT